MIIEHEISLFALNSILFFIGGFLVARLIQCRRVKEKNEECHIIPDYYNLYQEAIKNKEIDQNSLRLEVIEKEQKRIALELHDDTVQRIVAVRLRLEQLLYYRLHKNAEEDVQMMRKELDEIVATLRFLIKGLTQPRFDNHSFFYHIQKLVEKISVMHHQTVVLEQTNEELAFEIPPHIQQELFYMVQKITHNYLKSSTGFILTITMRWGHELTINIQDNGQGLQRGRGFGLGMISMKERSDRIGADLTFNSMIRGLNVQIKIKNTFSQESIAKGNGN